MAEAATTTPATQAEPLQIPDLFASGALLTAALTLMTRALKLEWRVHFPPSGEDNEDLSSRTIDSWIQAELALEMARDEAEPDSTVRRLAELFLTMMPGTVSCLNDLSDAQQGICAELEKEISDPEVRQVAVLSRVIAGAMIGNCQYTGVPNAGIRVMAVH